jgi:hypothetical protein
MWVTWVPSPDPVTCSTCVPTRALLRICLAATRGISITSHLGSLLASHSLCLLFGKPGAEGANSQRSSTDRVLPVQRSHDPRRPKSHILMGGPAPLLPSFFPIVGWDGGCFARAALNRVMQWTILTHGTSNNLFHMDAICARLWQRSAASLPLSTPHSNDREGCPTAGDGLTRISTAFGLCGDRPSPSSSVRRWEHTIIAILPLTSWDAPPPFHFFISSENGSCHYFFPRGSYAVSSQAHTVRTFRLSDMFPGCLRH